MISDPRMQGAEPLPRQGKYADTGGPGLHNTKSTSVKSYYSDEVREQIPRSCRKVLEALQGMGSGTNRMIASRLDTDPSTVSARRNELMAKGLVAEGHKAPCRITGRTAIYYRTTEPGEGAPKRKQSNKEFIEELEVWAKQMRDRGDDDTLYGLMDARKMEQEIAGFLIKRIRQHRNRHKK